MNIHGAIDKYDKETSTHIVAYLDVLGVALKMKTENQAEPLNKLYTLYKHSIELSDGETGIKKYADFKFRIFSDNILIASELPDDPLKRRNTIESLLNCVSNFATSCVGDGVGWLLRGGITIGEFFINDTIVWGSALLRAYELEVSIANYPRIAIDTSILFELRHFENPSDFILTDIDGISYLNYIHIWHFSGQFVKNGFEKMKKEAKKPNGSYPDRVYQKLVWHMNYINHQLDIKNEHRDKKYRLTLEL